MMAGTSTTAEYLTQQKIASSTKSTYSMNKK